MSGLHVAPGDFCCCGHERRDHSAGHNYCSLCGCRAFQHTPASHRAAAARAIAMERARAAAMPVVGDRCPKCLHTWDDHEKAAYHHKEDPADAAATERRCHCGCQEHEKRYRTQLERLVMMRAADHDIQRARQAEEMKVRMELLQAEVSKPMMVQLGAFLSDGRQTNYELFELEDGIRMRENLDDLSIQVETARGHWAEVRRAGEGVGQRDVIRALIATLRRAQTAAIYTDMRKRITELEQELARRTIAQTTLEDTDGD